MQYDYLQFYPTGKDLAEMAWAMFEEKDISRLLEPSAGRGDLVMACLKGSERDQYHGYSDKRHGLRFDWDAVEIDPQHHPLLRDRGATVVGHNFLHHTSCAIYSHILMNPPFNQGAQHVLHAWNTLFDGEIVAIINAETLRNPYSAERQMLLRIVTEHGNVRFVQEAFQGPDVERSAQVEIALVHLVKRADKTDMVGNILDGLAKDNATAADLGWDMPHELALPTNFVETTVRNYDLALVALKQSAIAQARASVYKTRLGQTMAMLQQKGQGASACPAPSGASVRAIYSESYAELKSAGWAQILRSTEVLSRLSRSAQKRVESEFSHIAKLEFTVGNIYGFLHGLAQNAGDIQIGMVCDVFDNITRYHTENAVYYMGWKSNDKHRTAGMRIKRTRFIIPHNSYRGFGSTADWEMQQWLADYDKVFAMLDGKTGCETGLLDLFNTPDTFNALLDGERLSSDYFDVRYYKGRGTVHFFPRNAHLIERLNRVVGQHRQWLPPSMESMDPDFKTQYEQAEKFDKEVRKAFAAQPRTGYYGLGYLNSADDEASHELHKTLCQALDIVLGGHDLYPQAKIEAAQLLLLETEVA